MIVLLLKLGTVAQMISGGQLALEGIEEGMGIPLASGFKALARCALADVREISTGVFKGTEVVVEGVVDDMKAIVLHGRRPGPSQMPRPANKGLMKVNPRTPPASSSTSDTTKQKEEISALLQQISAKLDQADKNAAAIEGQADAEEDDARRTQLEARAMTMRNYASLAEEIAMRAEDQLSLATPETLPGIQDAVQWALSCANAANNPPTTAAEALASDVSDQVKSVVTQIIDNMSRAQEPDFSDLSDQILSDQAEQQMSEDLATSEDDEGDATGAGIDPGFYAAQLPEMNGPDEAPKGKHNHAHKHGSCKCNGQCDKCAWAALEGPAKKTAARRARKRHGRNAANAKTPELRVNGPESYGLVGFAGVPKYARGHDDGMPDFGQMGAGCETGTCPRPER